MNSYYIIILTYLVSKLIVFLIERKLSYSLTSHYPSPTWLSSFSTKLDLLHHLLLQFHACAGFSCHVIFSPFLLPVLSYDLQGIDLTGILQIFWRSPPQPPLSHAHTSPPSVALSLLASPFPFPPRKVATTTLRTHNHNHPFSCMTNDQMLLNSSPLPLPYHPLFHSLVTSD